MCLFLTKFSSLENFSTLKIRNGRSRPFQFFESHFFFFEQKPDKLLNKLSKKSAYDAPYLRVKQTNDID